MWVQQLFSILSTLVNSVYSDMVVISHVCNLRSDFKLGFFSNFWKRCYYFRACVSICSLWIYLQSLVLSKPPPTKSKMVPYNVCLPAKFLKKCHLLLSAWSNNDNGSSFEAKPHLTCALLWWMHRAQNSISWLLFASNAMCISVAVVQRRFANVGQFCVDNWTEILTVNVMYASVSTQI